MLHALFNGNVLLGLFSDYEKCNITINGLINNKFVSKEKIKVKTFIHNSITEIEYIEYNKSETEVEEFSELFTTDSIKPPPIITPEIQKQREEDIKERNELQNSLNLLRKQKEKLEENKRVYNVDLELYNRFKKLKVDDENFEIPEMFEEKYNVMSELESNNNLSWETFYENYKPTPINTSYSKLFE
jgi:hypothetical protein